MSHHAARSSSPRRRATCAKSRSVFARNHESQTLSPRSFSPTRFMPSFQSPPRILAIPFGPSVVPMRVVDEPLFGRRWLTALTDVATEDRVRVADTRPDLAEALVERPACPLHDDGALRSCELGRMLDESVHREELAAQRARDVPPRRRIEAGARRGRMGRASLALVSRRHARRDRTSNVPLVFARRWSQEPFVIGQSEGRRAQHANDASECVLHPAVSPHTGQGLLEETPSQSASVGLERRASTMILAPACTRRPNVE